jgi:Cu-processing system permease protein
VGTLFGALYYYSSREFIELLLALPLRRRSIFLGKYLGLSLALSASFLLGTLIPFFIFGLGHSAEIWNFGILLVAGVLLTFIFTGLACLLCISSESPIRGFGLALAAWLFLAVIYDGLFLLTLVIFEDYPLDRYALAMTLLNPVDLSRVLVMLKLDLSAMMGYTGAVFRKFLGTDQGMVVALVSLVLWAIVPLWLFIRRAGKKDF